MKKLKTEFKARLKRRNKTAIALKMYELHIKELEKKIEEGIEAETTEANEQFKKLEETLEVTVLLKKAAEKNLKRQDRDLDYILKKLPKNESKD